MWTIDLWSVTNVNGARYTLRWNFSHAHTQSRASPSVYEYLCSTADQERLAYATILASMSSVDVLFGVKMAQDRLG